jgi:hypothetical protein
MMLPNNENNEIIKPLLHAAHIQSAHMKSAHMKSAHIHSIYKKILIRIYFIILMTCSMIGLLLYIFLSMRQSDILFGKYGIELLYYYLTIQICFYTIFTLIHIFILSYACLSTRDKKSITTLLKNNNIIFACGIIIKFVYVIMLIILSAQSGVKILTYYYNLIIGEIIIYLCMMYSIHNVNSHIQSYKIETI